jgi:hypothetical protein
MVSARIEKMGRGIKKLQTKFVSKYFFLDGLRVIFYTPIRPICENILPSPENCI